MSSTRLCCTQVVPKFTFVLVNGNEIGEKEVRRKGLQSPS